MEKRANISLVATNAELDSPFVNYAPSSSISYGDMMTENPALKSATAVLLDYVEDTDMFATAMNESVNHPALLDSQCNFLREPSAIEFMFVRAMLPADGAAQLLAVFESAVDQQMPWTAKTEKSSLLKDVEVM